MTMVSHRMKGAIWFAILVMVCRLAQTDAKTGSCLSGFATCKNGRTYQTTLNTDPDNCGSCGTRCPKAPHSQRKCKGGTCNNYCNDREWRDCDKKNCNGCEANVDRDPKNCGACGVACTVLQNGNATCSRGGICGSRCANGFKLCNNTNTNTTRCLPIQNVVSNCGGCGQVCPSPPNSDATCALGTCGFTCSSGFDDCDRNASTGCKINTNNDLANCGACGRVCTSPPNKEATCIGGTCSFTCQEGYANCDGNATNGCEINTSNDVANCDACRHACPAAPPNSEATCTWGNCDFACHSGFTNCDGNAGNGCKAWTWGIPGKCDMESTCGGGDSRGKYACDLSVTDLGSRWCITDLIGDGTCGYSCSQVCQNHAFQASSCSFNTQTEKCEFTCNAGYEDADGLWMTG